MKNFTVLIIAFLFPSIGCATSSDSYNRYIDAKRYQLEVERKPLIELSLDKDGKLESL